MKKEQGFTHDIRVLACLKDDLFQFAHLGDIFFLYI